jgi:competence protein ComEC
MQACLAIRLRRRRPRPITAGALVAVGALGAAVWLTAPGQHAGEAEPGVFRISVLDVGQGDAILMDPPGGEPILVDAGPPGDGIGRQLHEHRVDSLAAVVVTHDQSDHAGGLAEVLESVPVARVGYAEAGADLLASVRAAGTEPLRLSEGRELRSGALRLTVLWPPAAVLGGGTGTGGGVDPNQHSLVLLVEWRHLSLLLTGDAEAEAVPIAPGPVDVLKVGHHGSEDEGLGGLLERSVPKLAVISVGDNSYGHPTPETLAELREHNVPVARTDLDGTIEIEADASGWRSVP